MEITSFFYFAGFGTVLWFTASSQIFLIYLCVARLQAVISPMKARAKTFQDNLLEVVFLHLSSLSVSVILSLTYKFSNTELPTTLCLPFFDPTGSSTLIKVFSWMAIFSQSISSVIITVFNCWFIYSIKGSGDLLISSKHSAKLGTKMILQLIITTFSNVLCWLPANTIYALAMILSRYPVNLTIFTTVIVMPVNSIINPCVFIIVTVKEYISSLKKN